MADETRLIVNPERPAPAEALADLVDDVVEPDDAAGLGDAARAMADADVVAAVGGDGTQRTVAAALAHRDASLLVVPAGTVNFLGRLHGIHSAADARRALVDGEDRPIDLGRCDGEPFLLNASTGYDADVIAGVDERAKRFGRLGYLLVGVARLVRAERHRCRVVVDGGERFDGDALTVLVMNVAHRGSTRLVVAPGARADDGRLHVLVLTGRAALVRAVWAFLRHRRPRPADAVAAAGTTIDVAWDAVVRSQRDGDPAASGRTFRYDVDPGAVTLRVPR